MPFALFDCDRQVGEPLPSELEVWKQALESGLITGVPVADEGGQVLPPGYHVKEVRVEESFKPKREWDLPKEIS
jgi:hypothetical protein